MKLSKKNRNIQRAIATALSSGKALGGLLAGLAATTLVGCKEQVGPHVVGKMTDNPQPTVEEANHANELPFEGEMEIGEIPDVSDVKENNQANGAAELEGVTVFAGLAAPVPQDSSKLEKPNKINEDSKVIPMPAGVPPLPSQNN